MDAKVYVGGLPSDATQQELAEAFDSYGKIRKVWVARRPPGFAFIEFDDPRDAEDAVRGLDGTRICGVRARVELSHGRRRGGQYGGYDRRRSRSRSPSRTRSRSPPRRSRTRSRSPPSRGSDRKRSPSRSPSRSPLRDRSRSRSRTRSSSR